MSKALKLLAILFLILCFGCGKPTKYESAKKAYEQGFKKVGTSFYRTKAYKKVLTDLDSVPKSHAQYKEAQALSKKLKDDFLAFRKQNVRVMMKNSKEAIKRQEETEKALKNDKPYSELKENEIPAPK